jgi:hypothetical protein
VRRDDALVVGPQTVEESLALGLRQQAGDDARLASPTCTTGPE